MRWQSILETTNDKAGYGARALSSNFLCRTIVLGRWFFFLKKTCLNSGLEGGWPPDNLSGRCKLSSSVRSVSRSERAHPSIHAAALIPILDGGGGGAIRVGDCRRRCHCLSSFSPSEGKCDILTDWGWVGSLPHWLTWLPPVALLRSSLFLVRGGMIHIRT